MAKDTTVITTVVVATLINVGATQIEPWAGQAHHSAAEQRAWDKRSHDPFAPIVGGFIVGGLLLALSGKEPGLAEVFAAAFLITSLTLNGQPLITALTTFTKTL